MKYFNYSIAALLAGGMITIGSVKADAQNLRPNLKSVQKTSITKPAISPKSISRKVVKDAAIERQPQKLSIYMYENEKWNLSTKSESSYNKKGMLDSCKTYIFAGQPTYSNIMLEKFKYNEDGYETEKITESYTDSTKVWLKETRDTKMYDKVRKDVAIISENFIWDEGSNDWMLNEEFEDGFFYELERDAKNRVTKSTHWINRNKEIALEKFDYKYANEEGPATEFTWSSINEEYKLVPTFVYDNVKWKKSDSQYITTVPNIYYLFDNDTNNVIEKYSISECTAEGTKGEKQADYTNTFDEKGRLKTVSINFANGAVYSGKYTYDKDEFGSFEMFESTSFDEDGDGKISDEEKEDLRSSVTFNKYGEIIKEEIYLILPGGEELMQEGYDYNIKYNDEELIEEILVSYYTDMVDNGSYVLFMKQVFSDYTDNVDTGIEKISNNKAEATVIGNNIFFKNANGAHYRICDIQGKTYKNGIVNGDSVSISDMPKGMYIVKINGKNNNNAVKLIKR